MTKNQIYIEIKDFIKTRFPKTIIKASPMAGIDVYNFGEWCVENDDSKYIDPTDKYSYNSSFVGHAIPTEDTINEMNEICTLFMKKYKDFSIEFETVPSKKTNSGYFNIVVATNRYKSNDKNAINESIGRIKKLAGI